MDPLQYQSLIRVMDGIQHISSLRNLQLYSIKLQKRLIALYLQDHYPRRHQIKQIHCIVEHPRRKIRITIMVENEPFHLIDICSTTDASTDEIESYYLSITTTHPKNYDQQSFVYNVNTKRVGPCGRSYQPPLLEFVKGFFRFLYE